MSPIVAPWILGLTLLSCMLCSGCQSSSELASVGDRDGLCQSAAECGANSICQASACIDAPPLLFPDLALEVTPPVSSTYTRLQVLSPSLTSLLLEILLTEPTHYEARVLDSQMQRQSAYLSIFGDRRIPGREIEFSELISATSDRPQILRLLAGDYAARILPVDESIPGIEIPKFSVSLRLQPGIVPREFIIPRPEEYGVLHGQIVAGTTSTVGVTGAVIRARSINTGLPSTEVMSSADGSYHLLLPKTEDTSYRLTVIPRAEEQPAWGFEQTVLLSREDAREKVIPLEPTDSSMRVRLALQIRGELGNGALVPIPAARISLTALPRDTLDSRIFRVLATTDADGIAHVLSAAQETAELELLKAIYAVEIDLQPESEFSRLSGEIDLTAPPPGSPMVITLARRSRVRGSIVSSYGSRVTNAALEWVALDHPGILETNETDQDGEFNVALSPGRYLVIVRPDLTPGANLFPVGTQEVSIPGNVASDRDVFLEPLSLPEGFLLRGRITWDERLDFQPVAEAKLEIFTQVADLTVSLGTVRTDADGIFSLVVPHPSP